MTLDPNQANPAAPARNDNHVTANVSPHVARLSTEAVHVIAQSLPNLTTLTDAAAAALAPDAEYRLREIIQDSLKFMNHSKRHTLMPDDINAALRLRNVEPLYGFGRGASAAPVEPHSAAGTAQAAAVEHLLPPSPSHTRGGAPQLSNSFHAPGSSSPRQQQQNPTASATFNRVDGVSDLFFLEDNEVNLKSMLQLQVPPVPLEVTVATHWLAIDGVQPSISQNPPPDSASAAAALASKLPPRADRSLLNGGVAETHGAVHMQQAQTQPKCLDIKPVLKHVLSRELQLYYDHVTAALFEGDASHLDACLASISQEPGLVQLLPYFTLYVFDSVNKSLRNVSFLFSIMRLVRALLENSTFRLENYLHQLLPAVITCLVGKRLCSSPRENHWTLRDYSADLIADICARYGPSYASVQPRITKTLIDALLDPRRPLTTHYGAIVGLASLGKHVVARLLLPHIAKYARIVQAILEDPKQKSIRRLEAAKVYGALAWALSVVPSDHEEDGKVRSTDPPQLKTITISKKRVASMLPSSTELLSELEKEFSDRLYPHGGNRTDSETAALLATKKIKPAT